MSMHNTLLALGRWGPRDFLKGRTKKGGAIHTRHTHGSKGRYKRLSTNFSIRDGRRHASNHTQGGLGIKLGGGLFGLRIPRQHMLSSITREEFEIEVHGHPNITNPYRKCLDKHPDLQSVMENAAIHVHLVVLLPRARRDFNQGKIDDENSVDNNRSGPSPLPETWKKVAGCLSQALQYTNSSFDTPPFGTSLYGTSASPLVVHWATIGASVTSSTLQGEPNSFELALQELYAKHCRGVKLKKSSLSSTSSKGDFSMSLADIVQKNKNKLGKRLFGTSLRKVANDSTVARNPKSTPSTVTRKLDTTPKVPKTQEDQSFSLELQDEHHKAISNRALLGFKNQPSESSSSLLDDSFMRIPEEGETGIWPLLHSLKRLDPNLLCLCMRFSPEEEKETETNISTTFSSMTECANSLESSSPSRLPSPQGSCSQVKRRILKAEIDFDETISPWKDTPIRIRDVFRWHYSWNDPRAHNSDDLPHQKRIQRVCVLVDASKIQDETDSTFKVCAPSLILPRFSEEITSMGFKRIEEKTFFDLLNALKKWEVDAQWIESLKLNKTGLHSAEKKLHLTKSDAKKHAIQ